MKIQTVTTTQSAFKSKMVVPKTSKFVDIQKNEYINELKAMQIADIFEKFEENFRTTMETFIYMIKH